MCVVCIVLWLAGEDVSFYEMKKQQRWGEVCEGHVWEGKDGAGMVQY
jgi:hypothetical protein